MSDQTRITAIPLPTEVSEEEVRESFAGPAIHANKVYVSSLPSGVRLSFAEAMPNVSPRFRAAILMSYPDALSLRDVLSSQLRDVENQIREMARLAGAGDGR